MTAATIAINQSMKPISARRPVVLIVADSAFSWIVINYFRQRFDRLTVLQERPEDKWTILRRRRRLLGPLAAISQAMAGVLLKFIARASRSRNDEICRRHELDRSHAQGVAIRSIGSVNSTACRDVLRELNPAVVAVYGVRIIKSQTLNCVAAPFINYHAGITPKYRGQHPGYWALVEDDREHAGVTIHLIDEGVDTGGILDQARVDFSPRDNITTYQYAQMAVALPLFAQSIAGGLAGTLTPRQIDLPSKLWFPPTLWRYLCNGLSKGIW